MSLRRALARRSGAVLAGITALTAVLVTTPARAAAPAYTLEERAQAIAQPSLVFLEMLASGVIREKSSGAVVSTSPITVSARCSGFVINSAGHAVTIRSCVSPTLARVSRWAFDELADQQVKAGKLADKDVSAYVSSLTKNTEFTGEAPGTAPVRRLFAQTSTTASAGLSAAPAIEADVVDPSTDADTGLAVVKISQAGLPVVELTNTPTPPDAKLLALGYASAGGGNFVQKVRSIKITGVSTGPVSPAFILDEKLPLQNRGGMAVDLSGRAVGLFVPDDKGDIRVLADAPAIAAQLGTAGVSASLGEADRRFREGLDAYFGGRYAEAIKKLGSVVAASPGNHIAEQYRKLAQDRLVIEGDAGGTPTWMIVLFSALGGAVLVAVAALLFIAWQHRSRAQAARDEALVPLSVNPFAPTSGMPSSGAGAYPVSGGNLTYPGYGPPPALEIPQPAPAGVPVPQPPVSRPPSAEPPAPVSAEPEPTAPVEDVEPAQHTLPTPPLASGAAPTPEPPREPTPPPAFAWPEDDDNQESAGHENNPWSPLRGRTSGEQ